MSQEKEKWLTNQLLDFFEKNYQIKNLKPALVGMTKKNVPILKKSPKFTAPIRMLLLAIAKYKDCYLSVSSIALITGISKKYVRHNLKILDHNKIITCEHRLSKSGDSDSNLYRLDTTVLISFFAERVGAKSTQVSKKVGALSTQGECFKHLPVGALSTPINKKGFNKGIKQESTRNKRASLPDHFSPSKSNADLLLQIASKTRSTPEILMKKFKNLQKSKDKQSADWDAELENFLLNERPLGLVTGGKESQDKVTSTVPAYGPGHPTYDFHHPKEQGGSNDPESGSNAGSNYW
jgi:hypothetical protein